MGNLLASSYTRPSSGPTSDCHQDLHSPVPQKKQKRNQGGAMDADASLPEEIIVEIVMRLPVKSVGRCRCVSTRWRSLFSDPQFAKSQFQVSPKHRSLIFQQNYYGEVKTLGSDLSDTAFFEKESLDLRDMEAPFMHSYLRFLGSCNGLVAARGRRGVFIWNPSTRFFKKLPSRLFLGDIIDISGFGCVSSNDEYKLVMGAEIFSSKTSSWKPIEIPGGRQKAGMPVGIFGCGMSVGVLCKGALHWRDYTDEHKGQLRLYAFDLEKEEFSLMKLKLPSALQYPFVTCDFGVTCEGCLFGLTLSLERDCGLLKFWVLREYGNSDSWTSSLSVKIPACSEWRGCDWFCVRAISVMETSAFVWVENLKVGPEIMPAIYRNEEQNTCIYMIQNYFERKVVYEESLCCLA